MSARRFRVIAVQPKWHVHDFTSAGAFRRWMHRQLELARPHLSAEVPNLVVLTELNGLPLVLRGAPWVSSLGSLQRAIFRLVLWRLLWILPIMLREKVSAVRALQLADIDRNVRLYLHTCRDLAQHYGVYLCCGSTPMPRYSLRQDQLVREDGVLTNQTVLLDPQGRLIGTADKVFLTPTEGKRGVDLSVGQLAELRVFPTPVGDLGVAISLDAFEPEVIAQLEAQGCTVLLQPDANGAPWTAKEGLPPDPRQLRDQPLAWLESSWTASTQGQSIRYAVNPMVVGNLLDIPFDGQSAITGRLQDAPERRSYALTEPRPGFIALAPWVADGPAEFLRATGRHLAPNSGHALENQYHSDVLSAELELAPSTVPSPEWNAHEQALHWLLQQGLIQPRAASPVSALPGLQPLRWILALLAGMLYARWRKR